MRSTCFISGIKWPKYIQRKMRCTGMNRVDSLLLQLGLRCAVWARGRPMLVNGAMNFVPSSISLSASSKLSSFHFSLLVNLSTKYEE